MTKCKVRYDYYYQQWVVEDNNGNLTYHDTKQQLEDYLDWQENIYRETASGNNEGSQNEAE
jgi:hypothetical protein